MIAYVALGSNQGDRREHIDRALAAVAALDGVGGVMSTTPVLTGPLWGMDQPAYLNAMVRFDWHGGAPDLLGSLQRIEQEGGRERGVHWGNRTIDLDLVRFGDILSGRPELTLPHPGLRDRMFWMRQIAELESDV